jgi:hypothetical protein
MFTKLFCFVTLFTLLFFAGCAQDSSIDNTIANDPSSPVQIADHLPNTGAVKVDSDCSNGCDRDMEDNTIAPSQDQTVWLLNEASGPCDSLYYEIIDNPTQQVLSTGFLSYDSVSCFSDKYARYGFVAPAAGNNSTAQSATMKVYCGTDNTAPNIGSDSFRLVNNSNCLK